MRIGLFIPCYIDAFFPEVGIATLELLERFGHDVAYPHDQTCCGQPMANSGFNAEAADTEALFVRNFSGFEYVVAPSGSCVHHVRDNFDAIEQTDAVKEVRARTYELVEFLHDILKVDAFPWARFPHRVGLHNSCGTLRQLKHARPSELHEPFFSKPMDLLSKVEGIEFVEPARPDECCGFGGTFSVFEEVVSTKMGYDKVRDHAQAGAEYIVSADSSCLMHQQGCAERIGVPMKFIHIAADPERSQRMSTARENRSDGAMLHPELRAENDPDAIVRDGRRLDHAEGASKPLRPQPPEPQPRGARVRGNRPIDQAEAAARFIAAPEHEKMHDERLWDLRQKRDREMHGIPEWEELRSLASAIKEHTLTHLDKYLDQFEANARSNGIHVHWARDGAEHNQIVHGILRDHGAKSLIKSKSMLTEECGFRPYMASVGIEVIETDLGERIQQLDNEDPSHVVVPAVHKLRTDVAEVFATHDRDRSGNSDVHYLAEAQREATRPLILKADAGMTGCNFAVAETGTFVVCTNEGNADLSANVPKLHIASIGIEKIIPRLEHLAVFIRLLSRSALGSPITQYTSHFRGPRTGGEMHVVLVDNGRSERLGMGEFWTSLKCIRCGACMNTCPVYRRSGGLSYGATYSGPIGLIIDPTFNARKYSNLPFASSLNGSCSNVCPVKINIHEQIYAWRRVLVERA